MLRLPRDSNIFIHFRTSNTDDVAKHVQTYLTEIRTIARLNSIDLDEPGRQRSTFSFRDYLTDDVELIFDLVDSPQTRELVEKHEERLSRQVDKLHDDLAANDAATKFHQEKNDLENVEREQRRREILVEDLTWTERRHDRFVELAEKRTIVEKKKKVEKRP